MTKWRPSPEQTQRYNKKYKARKLAWQNKNRKQKYHEDPDYRIQVNREKAKRRKDQKLKVLTHYGKDGNCQCCWDGCQETDPDVLSIDHVENNGAAERKELTKNQKSTTRNGGGHRFYQYLKRNQFPSGYQTLCMNHQWKKELIRRRDEAEYL